MPYTTATPGTAEFRPDGTYRLPVTFSGSGVPDVPEATIINNSTTVASLKAWGIAIVTALNQTKSVVDLPAIVNKTPIDLTPPTPTAVEIATAAWASKIGDLRASQAKLARWTALNITASGALATAITALQTSITNQGTTIVSDYNAADAPTRTAMQGVI